MLYVVYLNEFLRNYIKSQDRYHVQNKLKFIFKQTRPYANNVNDKKKVTKNILIFI